MAVPLLIVGTVISAISAVSNADSQRRAANTNADNARNAAAIGIDQGNAQAAIQARQSRAQLDAARAQYGASGVDENAGSPLDVLQSSAMNASLDNSTIKYNAQVKAFGYGAEASSYDTQASAATTKGNWQAGSDILSGGSKAYGAMYPNPNAPINT
jgi:hypothetical protein